METIIGLGGGLALALIMGGLALEIRARSMRARRVGASFSAIRRVIRAHPFPVLGLLETLFWLAVLVTLADHLRDPDQSVTAQVTWYLTIGIHELGHLVCMPFGWLLHVAGGSIWQVLFWAGLGAWVLVIRRQVSGALLLWAITGHSLINLARYINDARARELPLLFGMGKENHDWWNILSRYNLLAYDHRLAQIVTVAGALLVIGAALAGIAAAWALPRVGWGRRARVLSSVRGVDPTLS